MTDDELRRRELGNRDCVDLAGEMPEGSQAEFYESSDYELEHGGADPEFADEWSYVEPVLDERLAVQGE